MLLFQLAKREYKWLHFSKSFPFTVEIVARVYACPVHCSAIHPIQPSSNMGTVRPCRIIPLIGALVLIVLVHCVMCHQQQQSTRQRSRKPASSPWNKNVRKPMNTAFENILDNDDQHEVGNYFQQSVRILVFR